MLLLVVVEEARKLSSPVSSRPQFPGSRLHPLDDGMNAGRLAKAIFVADRIHEHVMVR